MRQRVDRLGFDLGKKLGNYPIAGVGGGLAQLTRRIVVAVAVVFLGSLVIRRPPAAFTKGAVMVGVLLAVFGLTLAWRRATARLGINRCHLYADGFVVTNLLGGVRDVVAWNRVTALNRIEAQSLLMSFHRLEFARRGSGDLGFVILGLRPALVEALLTQAAKNGIH
ncbi:hypothetical protein [Streptomyces sp. NPDC050535]|uniref:hypothetical protein n=1 Tax=Streptomyces sp. NPDC050535 TaxID=3365626 RepID=UPI0037A0026A